MKKFFQRITGIKPEAQDFVWVHADRNHPYSGIAVISETKPVKRPVFKVMGIKYEKARLDLMGKVLNWTFLKGTGDEITVDLEKFKGWFY